MALVIETFDPLKGKLQTWKGPFESKWLRLNINKTKMMISRENTEKVAKYVKFPCAVWRESVGINSILCQICWCWLHKRCGCTGCKLKEHSKFRCQTYANQSTEIAKDCPNIVLNGQSLESAENFSYLGVTIGARGGVFDSVITKIRSRWCKLVTFFNQ